MEDAPRRTLGARLAERDRLRFTGRLTEIAFLDRCLRAADPPASVVHVCGPGGIGKSTLLREVGRRAEELGRTVVALDGRELGPAPGALDAALTIVSTGHRPVVLLDSYEQMTALDPYLRRTVVPDLPDETLVVTAGRRAPDPGWLTGGWESVTARLDLRPMAPAEAGALLAARGVSDERVPAIIEWAAGSPLALALAGDAAAADASWNAARLPDRPDILRSLLLRLVETELQDIRPSALGVAVVARSTTPELLRAVLPDQDAAESYRRLSGLTVTEPLGNGIMMHDLVRKVLLADLRQRNPDTERELRRRIADHLFTQAIAGDPLLTIDLAHLVENPMIRWGFGWDGNVTIRIDAVRPGDAEQAQRGPGNGADPQLWPLTLRYFTEAPARVAVARDETDQMCGYMVCMSLATAPDFADTDPLMGPWLAHARRDAELGDSVLWQSAVDFSTEHKVQAMLGMAGVLRSGAVSPRFAYLPIDDRVPGAVSFAQAIGARHVPELDARFETMSLQCYRLDYGAGGLLVLVRNQIYAELGLPLPAQPVPVPPQPVSVAAVRDVLKNFRVPHELARSPLAAGSSAAERVESVRQLVRAAAAEAFGDSETEKLLHSVLMAGYLEPMRSHEEAAARLCMSRAAYFRRLRTAVERLAAHISARDLDG